MKSKIVYEDKNILVVYKPSGLATQTARVGQPDVVSELQNYCSRNPAALDNRGRDRALDGRYARPYIGVVHRLDQPVEGLLVFAKDKTSAARLSAQLGGGSLNKRYYAVVFGIPQTESGELVDYLIKDTKTQSARVVTEQAAKGKMPEGEIPKKAVLRYQVLKEIREPYPLTLMDIHIETGRFHQIRAQLAHAGLPILGDSRYAGPGVCDVGRELEVMNVALCAYGLTFSHPVTGENMEFTIAPEGKIFAQMA